MYLVFMLISSVSASRLTVGMQPRGELFTFSDVFVSWMGWWCLPENRSVLIDWFFTCLTHLSCLTQEHHYCEVMVSFNFFLLGNAIERRDFQ